MVYAKIIHRCKGYFPFDPLSGDHLAYSDTPHLFQRVELSAKKQWCGKFAQPILSRPYTDGLFA